MRAPTIPYPGAKGRLAPLLVSFMPVCGDLYFEPFAGRGNVFFAAAPKLHYQNWWLNDTSTAGFFDALKLRGDRVRVPPRTRPEYFRQKRLFEQRRSQRASLLEPYFTFSGGGYRKGGFGSQNGPSAEGYARTLKRCALLLRAHAVKVTGQDWQAIDFSGLGPDAFVFFDPPYFGADVRAYSNKVDIDALVKLMLKARFTWMLTEYHNDFYVKAFGNPFYTAPVQLACDGRGDRKRVECVWKNF